MDAVIFDVLYICNNSLEIFIKLIIIYLCYGFVTSSYYKNRRL